MISTWLFFRSLKVSVNKVSDPLMISTEFFFRSHKVSVMDFSGKWLSQISDGCEL